VNLNPSGSTRSIALATTGTLQAGYVTISGATNAGLWSGTAASFVNLNPSGATSSEAFGAAGTQEAGFAVFSGSQDAAIWSGTAAGFVNLNPTGSTLSESLATNGTQQAGFATISGANHAGIWSGTAASFVDLQTVLGSGYTSSRAEAISDNGTDTYVSGYAVTTSGQTDAVLWTIPDAVPEPTSALLLLSAGVLPLLRRHRRA
jgi:hypothetical protein